MNMALALLPTAEATGIKPARIAKSGTTREGILSRLFLAGKKVKSNSYNPGYEARVSIIISSGSYRTTM
jgi:hypothetical protein